MLRAKFYFSFIIYLKIYQLFIWYRIASVTQHCNYVYLIYIIYLFLLPERDNARRLFHARLVDLLFHVLVFIFFSMKTHCTRKVIGGELQERLIPVPYSKTSTDQAVRFLKGELFRCFTDINLFFVFI